MLRCAASTAALADVVDNRAGALFDQGIEQAGLRDQFFELLLESWVAEAQNIHQGAEANEE